MRCIKCGKDTRKKDRDARLGKCACRHHFATEPADDGLTDMVVKTAQDLVSANGLFYFLQEHLHYQLLRRTRKKLKWCSWFITASALIFFPALAFAGRGGTWIIAIISFAGLSAAFAKQSSLNQTTRRLRKIVGNWIRINPDKKLLTAKKTSSNIAKPSDNPDLEAISFERVLICDREEYVDFFLANLFHFHYSCPVLGGNFYPRKICPDMLRRLKNNQQLDVFLLHDYTPQGYAFAKQVQTDPDWFGGDQTNFNIIDLGLLKEQQDMFKSMLVKPQDLATGVKVSTRLRKNKKVAELTLFRPETLITLCGNAINEKVPLHKVSSKVNDSTGGYG